MVGARLRRTLRTGEESYLRGAIGGFHAGSQFTRNITAAYVFELCDRGTVTYSGLIVYRLLDVDYSRGSAYSLYTFDVLMQGPLVGLAIGFGSNDVRFVRGIVARPIPSRQASAAFQAASAPHTWAR